MAGESVRRSPRRILRNLSIRRVVYRVLAGYLFHRYFNAVFAASDELCDEVFRIRYDVYCDELRFEDTGRFPDKREIDDYDPRSVHCLLEHKSSETFAGCVRLVLVDQSAPDEPLPFERLCENGLYRDLINELAPDRTRVAEISRLAVRSRFRRRKDERGTPGGVIEERSKSKGVARTPWIALGLYLAAAATGLIRGLDGVFALMEPRLARRLGSYGIRFVQVGNPVEHRGQRAPFFISRGELFNGLPPPVRGLLEVIERDLRKTGAERASPPNNPAKRDGIGEALAK
jgi:N-acyl amino acid synthase of PEP-CTERM/exosortase system